MKYYLAIKYPFHLLWIILSQKIRKTIYRIKLVLQEPGSWGQHYRIYIIKNTTRKTGTKFFKICELKKGHPVTVDNYVLDRVRKLKHIVDNTQATQEELKILCQTDHNMGVYGNMLIEGNGRFTALKLAGFKGLVEVDFYEKQ